MPHFPSGFRGMARLAKHLAIGRGVWVLIRVPVQRPDMVNFRLERHPLARLADVQVTQQDRFPGPLPPGAVQLFVKAAHGITMTWGGGGGPRSIIGSASPAAITAADNVSIRPLCFALSNAGLP